MSVREDFQPGQVLSSDTMAKFVQTTQIAKTITADENNELIPTMNLLNTVVNGVQAFQGEKMFKGNLRMTSEMSDFYGGKINFGDADNVFLAENENNTLIVKAGVLNLNGVSSVNLTGAKIKASDISIVSNQYLGYSTNLQDALTYIAETFHGDHKVFKITTENLEID